MDFSLQFAKSPLNANRRAFNSCVELPRLFVAHIDRCSLLFLDTELLPPTSSTDCISCHNAHTSPNTMLAQRQEGKTQRNKNCDCFDFFPLTPPSLSSLSAGVCQYSIMHARHACSSS